MRLRVALSMLAVAGLAVPAMAKDLGASLRGRWTVDKVALIEAGAPPFYKIATPEKQKEFRDDMMKRVPDMSVEITATNLNMTAGTDAPEVATYKVTRSDKNT